MSKDEPNTENNDHNEVSIHLDKKELKSPSPTTGEALYTFGGIDSTKYDLFFSVNGKGDDQLIPNDQTFIKLEDGSNFYTAQKDLNPGA